VRTYRYLDDEESATTIKASGSTPPGAQK
jgi:type IV pilus assembly protein PilO